MLTRSGCRSDEAANSRDALALLHSAALVHDPFRVAFLDSDMPATESQELAKHIASDPEFKEVAVVFMVPLGRERNLNSLHLQGFAGSLSKPVWQASLYRALGHALRERRSETVESPEVPVAPRSMSCNAPIARVLIVDDNVTNQQVASAILRKLGHQADVVGCGTEALDALRTADYDVVLMDCEMPMMDGYETARQIRLGSNGIRNPDIPILAVTAHAMRGDREKCIAAGMNDYLPKPIEPGQLAAILPKLLPCLASPPPVSAPAVKSPSGREVVFDPEELLARLSGDESLARKIVAGFLTHVPGQLQTLAKCIESGDAPGVSLQAHAIKGAAAAVAAPALHDLCGKIEQVATPGNLSSAGPLLTLIEQQLEKFRVTLTKSGWVPPSTRRK